MSQQIHGGRSEITKEMTRHASVDTLNKHYNKIVKDKIIKLFNLTNADIRTSNTGENGEDVKLLSITVGYWEKKIMSHIKKGNL